MLDAISDPASLADAVARVVGIGRAGGPIEYTAQLFQADLAGNVGVEWTDDLLKAPSPVEWDSTAAVPGSLRVTLRASRSVVWGSDIVAAFQLVRSAAYNALNGYAPGTWHRFPVGHYVLTSPGFKDLDAHDTREVTGFDKNYLLQNQPSDSMSWDAGTTYGTLVRSVFQAAGLVTTYLSEVADYPGSWSSKTLPDPVNYPMDGSVTFLDIVNEQLKASGCAPIYTQPDGRWQIATRIQPIVAALRWSWFGAPGPGATADDLAIRAVIGHQTEYDADVWNVPNQWVFIQDGLTFDPVEGSGQYTVNNTTVGPSDQTTVGRVVRSTQFLQASNQADLKTQGDAIVADAIAQGEKFTITTRSWPVGGQADVFCFYHPALPDDSTRRLVASRWELDLWGAPMRWTANAVAQL